MNNYEEFVLEALKEKSIMWEETTLRKVAFALIDLQNYDKLIEKIASRGPYDCIKLYAFFNFLIVDSVENNPNMSINKLKSCAEKLRQVDRTVYGLVNLKMGETDRRIQRIFQIMKEQTTSAQEMIQSMNRVKRNEPEIYSYQTYYSIYVLFVIESTAKNPSIEKLKSLMHLMKYLFMGMIEMPD